MTKLPEVNSRVTVESPSGKKLQGVVEGHGRINSPCFWLFVDKVNGEPKKPGTYPSAIVAHVNDIVK